MKVWDKIVHAIVKKGEEYQGIDRSEINEKLESLDKRVDAVARLLRIAVEESDALGESIKYLFEPISILKPDLTPRRYQSLQESMYFLGELIEKSEKDLFNEYREWGKLSTTKLNKLLQDKFGFTLKPNKEYQK